LPGLSLRRACLIRGFDTETTEKVLGSQRGTLSKNLSQLAAILWLAFLADPSELLRSFRA